MKKIILAFLVVIIAVSALALTAFADETNYITDIEKFISENNGYQNFKIEAIRLDSDENRIIVTAKYTNEDDEEETWLYSSEVSLDDYIELHKVNGSDLVYDYKTNQVISESVAEIIKEAVKPEDMGVDLNYNGFGNEGFSRNLKYMGLGMLGIFAVVGVLILITYIFNSVTGKKKAQ